MKNLKAYKLNEITYKYSVGFKKWEFQAGNHSLLVNCGGQDNAHKIARTIQASLNRRGYIDNLARANISQIVN